MTRIAERVSVRTGWTEGQVQTLGLATALALALTGFGVVPALGRAPVSATEPVAQPEAAVPLPAPEPASPVGPSAADPPPEPLPPPPPLAPAPLPTGGEPFTSDTASPFGPAAPAPPPPPASTSAGTGDVAVAASAWYTDDAGTPLTQLDNPVPKDGLPVAARATRATRFSVVRLSGDPTVATLQLSTTSTGQFQPDSAGVLLCPLLDNTWKPGAAQPMSAAPAYSPGDCVPGVPRQSAYAFPLMTFPVRVGGAGFALVPVSDPARPLFQVTFAGGAG